MGNDYNKEMYIEMYKTVARRSTIQAIIRFKEIVFAVVAHITQQVYVGIETKVAAAVVKLDI